MFSVVILTEFKNQIANHKLDNLTNITQKSDNAVKQYVFEMSRDTNPITMIIGTIDSFSYAVTNYINNSTNDYFIGLLKEIKNEKDATKAVDGIKKADYTIDSITDKNRLKNPAAPFMTSTLQQAAVNQLGFSVKKTMQLAQHASSSADKSRLLKLAEAWLDLADRAHASVRRLRKPMFLHPLVREKLDRRA